MYKILALAIVAVVGAMDTAQAGQPQGNYGGTGSLVCLYAPDGFNPDQTPVNPHNIWSASNSHGTVLTLNGDGTGTLTSFETSLDVPPIPSFPANASSSKSSAAITYTIGGKANDVLFLSVANLAGQVTSGPRTGQTFTVDAFNVAGFFSKSAKFFGLITLSPSVETITYSDGSSFSRICHRNTQFVSQRS